MLVLLAIQLVSAANTPQLCSNELTAQGGSQYLTFNSYGSCTENCQGYAFAIAQGNECWCSNEAPGSTVGTSNCDQSCPGFPNDICGGNNLYGYFQIGQPSGTASSSESSSRTTSSESSTSTSPSASSTSVKTSTSTTPASSSTEQSSTSESTSPETSTSPPSSTTPGSSSSVSSTEPSTTERPAVSYITITQSNSVQTITQKATPTQESAAATATAKSMAASASPTQEEHKGFFQNKGAVAGVFTVVGLVLLALLLLALFLCLRTRRRHQETSAMASSHHDMRSGRDSFAPLESDSQLVPIFDQRVDAQQMYMRWENNTSQQSLQDNQDYSRKVLRVANPDGD